MKINNFLEITLQDYSGKISSMVFTPGCNYKCPACHAAKILNSPPINNENFFNHLKFQEGWINGIVICGGEPTLQPDLEEFAREMKSKGYSVKLDTNGSNPEVLKSILEKNLVDYVAMDVKGPEKLYSKICGTKVNMDDIKKSIVLTSKFPDYEFRTTIVPVYKIENLEEKADKKAEFMNVEDITQTAKMIYDFTSKKDQKYFLQKFVPVKTGLLDQKFESFKETPIDLMEKMLLGARNYLPRTELR